MGSGEMERYFSFKSISVVIPVYNSQATLDELTLRIEKALSFIQSEIILVNDSSRDESWKVILELAERSKKIRGINLMQNYGQDSALLCGIRAARYDIIVTIDDDLQHPPEQIPALLDKIEQGYDLVYAAAEQNQQLLPRHLCSKIARVILMKIAGMKTAQHISAFRAFRGNLREAFADYHGPFVSIDSLLSWGAGHIGIHPVRFTPRKCGVSNYNSRKLILTLLNIVTGFSVFPLRMITIFGLILLLIGLGLSIFVLWCFLFRGLGLLEIPFYFSLGFFLSGLHLSALGIVAEYLARIYLCSIGRPPYAVLSSTDKQ